MNKGIIGLNMGYKFFLIKILSLAICTVASAQIQTGTWRTATTNTEYHQFTRNGAGAAVYINQQDGIQPILRLSSGTLSPNTNVRLTVENDGSVGIGTLTPRSKLDVNGSISSSENIIAYNPSNPEASIHMGWKNNIALIRIGGSGTGNANGMDIQTMADKSLIRVLHNGNVGIGTTTPTHKLEVNGTIRTKEIKLEASSWPDYVFGKGYGLMSLIEVKTYIDQNGHLPNLKPAKEYETEGVNMLDLNQRLLEKIEELTLHAISQDRTIKEQQFKMDGLTAESEKSNREIEEIRPTLKKILDEE